MNETFGLNITVDFGSVWALKNKKLVDGVTGNNNEIANIDANITDNGTANEPTGNGEQDGGGEQEKTVIDAQPENGNDNGEPAQSPETVADTEQAQNSDPDNNQDNAQNTNEEVLNDEQEQRKSDNQDNSENRGNDLESEKTVAELQAVIDDPESSDDDKQAAQELLNEIKSKE
jgi:anti-sigma28 factor (negative regulator of flagellin synthesis)